MKYLLLLLLSTPALADQEIELIGGSATYHVLDPTNYGAYGPSFTSNGRGILNLVGAVRYTEYKDNGIYWSAAGMVGQNSVFSPIYGGMYSRGYHYKYLDIGIIAGGYIQNDNAFTEKGLQNASLWQSSAAPVVGVGIEANVIIPVSDKTVIKLNTIVMPLIINETIGLGVKF